MCFALGPHGVGARPTILSGIDLATFVLPGRQSVGEHSVTEHVVRQSIVSKHSIISGVAPCQQRMGAGADALLGSSFHGELCAVRRDIPAL